MNTDDFSKDAYDAVIVESDKFDRDLTLSFGMLSYSYQNEEANLKA